MAAVTRTPSKPATTRHGQTLQRHAGRVRKFHAAVYSSVLLLAFTGWWLYVGGEGNPTPLARATGIPDTRLHIWIGRALVVLLVIPLVAGRKGIATFVRESLRFDRGDGAWWRRWPAAVFTGRFARHEGDFDPGQRIANVGIVAGVVVLVASGLAMTWLHGGTVFAVLAKMHLIVAALLTALLAGHILIASGVFPGYRGVWRSMHGGRVSEKTARRLWPGWAERHISKDVGRTPLAHTSPAVSVKPAERRRTPPPRPRQP